MGSDGSEFIGNSSPRSPRSPRSPLRSLNDARNEAKIVKMEDSYVLNSHRKNVSTLA